MGWVQVPDQPTNDQPDTDSPPVHHVENTVSLPAGVPETDHDAPKVALTQEQVDFLVDQAGKMWPTLKQYWPTIILVCSIIGTAGGMIQKAINPPAPVQQIPVKVEVKPEQAPAQEKIAPPKADAKLKDAGAVFDPLKKQVDALEKAIADIRKDQGTMLDPIEQQNRIIGNFVPQKKSSALRVVNGGQLAVLEVP